jgi:hypothetical protein
MSFAQASLLDKLQPFLPTLLLIVGVGVMIYFMMRRNSSLLRDSGDSNQEVRKTRALHAERDRDSALADAPDEILRWQVEMHATARDLKAEIDTKLMLLQALLKQVQEERQRLEELLAKSAENSSKEVSQEGTKAQS